MGNMRRRFWMWVHDSAEFVWHWTWQNKLATGPAQEHGPYGYGVTFVNEKGHYVSSPHSPTTFNYVDTKVDTNTIPASKYYISNGEKS